MAKAVASKARNSNRLKKETSVITDVLPVETLAAIGNPIVLMLPSFAAAELF